MAAVDYLLAVVPDDKPVRVWVNHSKTVRPSGVADVCCTLLNQTLVDLRYRVLAAIGRGHTLARPDRLPGRQKALGYSMLVGGLVMVALSGLRFVKDTRSGRVLGMAGLAGAAVVAGSLHAIKVDFYQGDNPGSPYYNLDQVRRLGIRYFWTVNSDYVQSTAGTIDLPEQTAPTGRPSIFRAHRFNDGSSGLMFLRNTLDARALTLSLLSDKNLKQLVARQGRSILYLHWLTNPASYFDAAGMRSLERLALQRNKIWITSAETLLDQAYAYSHVEYRVSDTVDGATVNITSFADPVRGRVDATLDGGIQWV